MRREIRIQNRGRRLFPLVREAEALFAQRSALARAVEGKYGVAPGTWRNIRA